MNLSILIFIVIISTCLSVALAAADVQSNNTNVILNHIISNNNNDNNGTNNIVAQQQLSCNDETTIQIYGMYPNKGNELGNTPVALAVQFDGNNDDDIRERLNCNFGSSIQPLINGDDMYDQLERIALAINHINYAANSTELRDNYELLLCKSPPATSIGHIPFHISCPNNNNNQEEQQTSSSIESSTLQFEYTIATSVHTIHPPLGTPNYYTTVTITGSGYTNSIYLSCFFGRDHVVFATYISNEEVQCSVPTSLPLSEGEGRDEYPMFISNNGIDYEGNELWSTVSFVTVPLPIVQSVESNTITWSTNSYVTVIGLHFDPHASLSKAICSFDFGRGDELKTSVGIVVNDTQINCPLPVLQQDKLAKSPFIGNIRVSTNDGIDYSTSYSSIFIYGPLTLQSVHPNSAALESGGTNITLYGLNFHPAKTLSCLFTLDNDYVIPIPATYYSSAKVECQTPQSMMADVAQLSVSTSNQDMSNSIDFTFLSLPTLISATPLSSSWSGGTIVTIHGSEFNTDDDILGSTYCYFGNALVLANVLNSTMLTCITPPVTLVRHDVSPYEASDGIEVTLEVSTNGHSTANSGITFQYRLEDSRFDAPLAITEDEVDTHQIDPTTVQVTSFSPTFGSEEGGTIIHLVGTGFDEEVSPQCVFNDGESSVATVISHTLVKCTVPAASLGQVNTSVGLSFNGDNLVMADTVFSYISSPIITDVSPKYISSSGGSKLIILGTNFTPNEHLVGVWKCSFGDTVVAASVTSEGDIVCFTPPIKPGVVEVRVSINGVEFTAHSVKVISHLPAEIHDYTLQDDDDIVVVDGINFQPSPDLSCIFNVQDGRITAVATWESNTKVTCSIPPIVVGATSTTLEISNTNEHHLDNPSIYADEGKRSTLVTCPTPEMMPGEYRLSLERIDDESAASIDTTTITVYPESSVLEETSQPFDISSSNNNNTDIRKLDELDTLLINIHPSFGPESGGNTVIINGSGFKANSSIACQFGDSSTPAKFVSDESLECIAPPVVNHLVVNVSLTIDGFESSSQTYTYLPMLRINKIRPSSMQSDEPHQVMITGDNFEYMPSHLMCKLGQTIISNVTRADETSVTCFIPPVYQPGEVTLDIVTEEDGTSMLEPKSNNTIKFHTPIDYSIFPSFADMTGGTNVIITNNNLLEDAPSLLTCRFNLNNDTSIDVVAIHLSNTRYSCVTPEMSDWSTDDHPIYATLSLVSEESHTSIPFMFKTTPIIESINPSIGSVNGNTLVRVRSSSSMWVNSTLLTCLFGEQEVRAIFVSANTVDCVSPLGRGTATVKVSDNNNINLPESNQIYYFHDEPYVSSVMPDFGLVSVNNVITFIGSGYSDRMESSCMLQNIVSGSTYQVKGSFINETAMECFVGSEDLPPSQYVCRASNNGGIEYGGFNATAPVYYTSLATPTITSIDPSSGLSGEPINVTVLGTDLSSLGSTSSPTYCVLLDHYGLRVSSSLAEIQSDTVVRCSIHCPSGNSTTKYSLGISLGGVDQVHSSSSFWCKPKTRILDVLPKYISVGESTPIGINLEEFRSSSTMNCVFGDGHEMVPAASIANGVVECPSPVFNHPQDMILSLSADNLTITEVIHIDVVDPISISRILVL